MTLCMSFLFHQKCLLPDMLRSSVLHQKGKYPWKYNHGRRLRQNLWSSFPLTNICHRYNDILSHIASSVNQTMSSYPLQRTPVACHIREKLRLPVCSNEFGESSFVWIGVAWKMKVVLISHIYGTWSYFSLHSVVMLSLLSRLFICS